MSLNPLGREPKQSDKSLGKTAVVHLKNYLRERGLPFGEFRTEITHPNKTTVQVILTPRLSKKEALEAKANPSTNKGPNKWISRFGLLNGQWSHQSTAPMIHEITKDKRQKPCRGGGLRNQQSLWLPFPSIRSPESEQFCSWETLPWSPRDARASDCHHHKIIIN